MENQLSRIEPTEEEGTDRAGRVQAAIGAGRGALIEAMFGSGWLGWGLGEAKAFNGFTGPMFGFLTLFLLASSIYVLRRGWLLRKEFPAIDVDPQRTMQRKFLLVVFLEFLLIALTSILADWLHRPDLATVWCALIVGLHFLPLATIFRAPSLGILGILMTLWSHSVGRCFAPMHLSFRPRSGPGFCFGALALAL